MATTKRKRPTTRRPTTAKTTPSRRSPTTPVARSATTRNLSIAGAVVGIGAAIAGAFAWLRLRAPTEGHEAPDLVGDTRPGSDERAPVAFRPDMDAPMTPAEREALRPATGEPTLVAGSSVGG